MLSLEQLKKLSPMPSDTFLMEEDTGAELVDTYDKIIETLREELRNTIIEPDLEKRVVQTLCNSFGLDSGFGIYWGALHLIEQLNPILWGPIVQASAVAGGDSCRYWCCFILARRRDRDDLPIFVTLLPTFRSKY